TSAAASTAAPSKRARGVSERVRAMVGFLVFLLSLVHRLMVVCPSPAQRWRRLACCMHRVARPVTLSSMWLRGGAENGQRSDNALTMQEQALHATSGTGASG